MDYTRVWIELGLEESPVIDIEILSHLLFDQPAMRQERSLCYGDQKWDVFYHFRDAEGDQVQYFQTDLRPISDDDREWDYKNGGNYIRLEKDGNGDWRLVKAVIETDDVLNYLQAAGLVVPFPSI